MTNYAIPPFLMYAITYGISLGICTVLYYDESQNKKRKYLPFLDTTGLLAIWIFAILLMGELNISTTFNILTIFCFTFFPITSIYYAFLIFVAPYLRKEYQHRHITVLWMLPAFLLGYVHIYYGECIPLFKISLSKKLVAVIVGIWFIGLIIVLIWKCLAHLMYRKSILKDCEEINEERILEIWYKELNMAKKKQDEYKLLKSNTISSPITIGMYNSTTCVIVPDKYYEDEKLILIFRHEILHICRHDIRTKFFLTFCNAFCWYNPLMWIAMRKCSEDIELSCDEAVLENENEATRKLYAHTILTHAESEMGFTSCLSASASSLKYRLENIMKPKRRKRASILIAISFFILCISTNCFVLAYEKQNALEAIYLNENINDYSDAEIYRTRYSSTNYDKYDVDSFNTYFDQLEVQEINRKCYIAPKDTTYNIKIERDDFIIKLTLSNHYIEVTHSNQPTKYYYSEKEINLEEIAEYLE